MSATLPDSTRTTQLYSADGDLRQQTTGTASMLFVRDGQTLLEEWDSAMGTVLRHYTGAPGEWGGLVSLAEGATDSRFFLFDQLGSTRGLLDELAALSDDFGYSAFGAELWVTGTSSEPLRYAGNWQYQRLLANKMNVGARIYDATTGAWLSIDPIGFESGDWNFYRYVSNSLPNSIDPSGFQSTPIPQPCPTPPPPPGCEAAKQRKQQACSGPPRTCNPNSSKKSSREYKRILNTRNKSVICPAISVRIANGIKCLRARYAVTQICFGGRQNQLHFDEEVIAYAVMLECIKELEQHCGKSHKTRLPIAPSQELLFNVLQMM